MSDPYDAALELAGELLGRPLVMPLGPGEPESGHEFRRLATLHTFGDSWSRTQQLDTRTRSLISVAIAAALGTHEPLRGQLRIALKRQPRIAAAPPFRRARSGASRDREQVRCRRSSGARREEIQRE
jgi:hypothetical protein